VNIGHSAMKYTKKSMKLFQNVSFCNISHEKYKNEGRLLWTLYIEFACGLANKNKMTVTNSHPY